MKWIRRFVIGVIGLACALAAVMVLTALRSEHPVGFQVTQASGPDGQPFAIGVWYPTAARAWPTTMAGARLMTVAKDAPVAGRALPLVVISHGNGAGIAAHADLALALASAGYVVAAPMHPGDNFQDQGAIGTAAFFNARSQQLHATLELMLGAWPARERIDAQRVGAFGMSMGGFTVLTLAGAQPDLRRIAPYCAGSAEFVCDVLRYFKSPYVAAGAPKAGQPFVADARIKAVVLAAPGLGFTFGEHALDQVRVPIQLWHAEKDKNVTDAGPLRALLKDRIEFHEVPGAGHLSFLAPCGGWLRPPAICADPEGFDRAAFHAAMNASVVAFFDKTLAPAPGLGSDL